MKDELSGRRDPSHGHSKELLIGFVRRVKDLRQQVRDLNADKADVKKEARTAGFDSTKIEEVVRWMERCEKHGQTEMEEAEALFDLYRDAVAGKGMDFDEIMNDARDRALLKKFAPDDQTVPAAPTRKVKAASNALAYAAVNQMLRGDG
ncbi:GapR family DNA-binding domain-containing protein [Sphingorhabdus pulchriflava]|nr:GapR family DNA-binding domain-containing protein [Sphingorhabdus pulchriflava]